MDRNENEMNLDQTPREDWSLEQLGEFVRLAHRRRTVDAWRMGRALCFAKALLHHGQWKAWLEEHCPDLSLTTVNRLMRLAKTFKDETDFDGVGLTEAYRMMTVSRPGSSAKAEAHGAQGRANVQPEGGGEAVPPAAEDHDGGEVASGAPSSDDSDVAAKASESTSPPEVPDEIVDDPGGDLQDELEEVLEEGVPLLMDELDSTLKWLFEQPTDLRRRGWIKVGRDALQRRLAILRGRLDDLEADMTLTMSA